MPSDTSTFASAILPTFDTFFEPPDHPELVPFYHFKMTDTEGNAVGHLNFRIGDTSHVRHVAGHIGYFVEPAARGRGYAYKACRAATPFVKLFYHRVILTAETDAAASIATIEKLGATYLDACDVPETDPSYVRGARRKRRYLWLLCD